MNTEMINGRKPLPVPLDKVDEKLLREVVASPIWSPSQIRRAEAVLGIAAGGQQCQLAEQIGFSVASIRRVCRQFQKDGMAGLLTERQRTGRPRQRLEELPRNIGTGQSFGQVAADLDGMPPEQVPVVMPEVE